MISFRTGVLLLVLPFLPVAAPRVRSRALEQDAYIWQRQWTPAVIAAVERSSGLIRAWHVLAAESDAHGHLRPVAVNWAALERIGRPVVLVARIDGQLARWDQERLIDDLRTLLTAARQHQFRLSGLEIDHDCGSARLGTYARFLARVRERLDKSVPLAITALPAWLSSPDLDALVAPSDEVVLQVHAISDPQAGLLDRRMAVNWIRAWAHRITKPFRVALPTYGVRVFWNDEGSVSAVEGEVPALAGDHAARELLVRPDEVSSLVRQLESDAPARLAGVTWFRLPTGDDVRTWSWETWRKVVLGTALQPRVEVVVQDSTTPGMSNVLLANTGDDDALIPLKIEIPGTCSLADGVNGYIARHGGSGVEFARQQPGLLRRRQQLAIGWMRCITHQITIHAPS